MSRPSCSTSSIQSKHCRWAEFRRIAAYALSPCYRSHLLNLSQREASVCACVRLMSIHTAIQTNQPRLAHPLLAGDPTYPWEELCRASVLPSVRLQRMVKYLRLTLPTKSTARCGKALPQYSIYRLTVT